MLALEKIISGSKIRGVQGTAAVEVVRVEWIDSDALNVACRGSEAPAEVPLLKRRPNWEPIDALSH